MEIYTTKAVQVAGSKARLARALGISRQAVSDWPKGKPIPKRRAAQLIEIYGEDAFK